MRVSCRICGASFELAERDAQCPHGPIGEVSRSHETAGSQPVACSVRVSASEESRIRITNEDVQGVVLPDEPVQPSRGWPSELPAGQQRSCGRIELTSAGSVEAAEAHGPIREVSRSQRGQGSAPTRADLLRAAIAAWDRSDLFKAASILEGSKYPIDRENAVNCRNLVGGSAQMCQMQRYLLQQHLEMAVTFGE